MKIGLQFAMPAEFHALPGAKELEAFETVSGVPFYEAAPGIIACAGGVSKVNAAMAAEILCLKYGVDMIVNAGVAGCLTELPTGSLVVAEDFVQHDVDTSAIGDPVGLVSTVNRVSFPTWKRSGAWNCWQHWAARRRWGGWPPEIGLLSAATGQSSSGTRSTLC